MDEALEELLKFLQIGARLDLKAVATEHCLGLTGTPEGVKAVYMKPKLLMSLISLLNDKTVPITKDASLCLINISADEAGASALVNLDMEAYPLPLQNSPGNIIDECLMQIFHKESRIADQCCMILSNLSRPKYLIETIVNVIEKRNDSAFDKLIGVFTKIEYNKTAKLHYLASIFSNLSQSSRVRSYILNKNKCYIQKLLPFLDYTGSLIRRGGVAGTLKNCCFENDFHEWLLSEDVDILPRLLLPLTGPEEFDEEDNDKLPLDLQYLPDNKIREEDPDIRCILIEAITQLCSKKVNREFIRSKNTYVILRELHKWEKDSKVLSVCENLVDILIRTEEEIGEDNLKQLDIPDHIIDRLEIINKDVI
ncbi:hypothetical protein ABEB36_006237 [Hypothenemus hampei]|uniref:Protein HGH1 homolog n=1 Tax=Hypothenemus hampei TaxID=57062 RepID=A0ABD1EPU3_HYPHA